MKKLLFEMVTVVKAGFLKSLKTLLLIAKIVIPISCLVSMLDAYSVLDVLSSVFNPLLKIIGLPGESALVLTLSYFLGYYASLGAMATLSLSGRDITVLAVMISIAHDLFIESAICKLIGWSFVKSFLFRLVISLAGGFILYRLYILMGC